MQRFVDMFASDLKVMARESFGAMLRERDDESFEAVAAFVNFEGCRKELKRRGYSVCIEKRLVIKRGKAWIQHIGKGRGK